MSWVETVGALTGMTFNPIVGWLSDKTVRRRGHRAGWIVGGTVLGCIGVLTATQVASLPLLVLVWACAQLGYCATFSALYGTLADIVPPQDRARVSGWFAASATGAICYGGLVGYALLTGHLGAALSAPRTSFVLLALMAVPVAVVGGLHLRTVRPRSRPEPHDEPVRHRRGALAAIRSLGDAGAPFWWLFVQRFVTQGAYACLTVYGVFFLIRRVGEQPEDAAATVALLTALGAGMGMVMAAGVARWLARLVGYRAAMGVGIVLMLGANLLLSVSASSTAMVVAFLCAGAGLGTYVSLDLAVALSVLPPTSGGRFLGIFNIARTLPAASVGALGPLLLAIGDGDIVGVDPSRNYFAFYLFGSALAVVALVLLTRITVPGRVGSVEPNPVG